MLSSFTFTLTGCGDVASGAGCWHTTKATLRNLRNAVQSVACTRLHAQQCSGGNGWGQPRHRSCLRCCRNVCDCESLHIHVAQKQP